MRFGNKGAGCEATVKGSSRCYLLFHEYFMEIVRKNGVTDTFLRRRRSFGILEDYSKEQDFTIPKGRRDLDGSRRRRVYNLLVKKGNVAIKVMQFVSFHRRASVSSFFLFAPVRRLMRLSRILERLDTTSFDSRKRDATVMSLYRCLLVKIYRSTALRPCRESKRPLEIFPSKSLR